MAGVKGRSGGPRKNAGGRRPGAGRPKRAVQLAKALTSKSRQPATEMTAAEERSLGSSLPYAPGVTPPPPEVEPELATSVASGDAKEFLEAVLKGRVVATQEQIRAAQALLPFQHQKLGEAGKKEQRLNDAAKVAGRFAPQPPRLAAVAGRKV